MLWVLPQGEERPLCLPQIKSEHIGTQSAQDRTAKNLPSSLDTA
jgi:hypothetical protein